MRWNRIVGRGALALATISFAGIWGEGSASAQTTSTRIQDAATVLQQIMSAKDQDIPQDLMDKAYCIVIIPNEKKAAFIVGGQYGAGYAVCRKTSGRGWGAPAAVRAEGGSVGFQIGGAETDVVMLVMSKDGMNHLLYDKFTLGGDVTAAAGPVGRNISAKTDAQFAAKILTWSRSRGVFGGVSLNGATLRNDLNGNKELYGREMHSKEILLKNMKIPAASRPLIDELDKLSPRQLTPLPEKG